MIVVDASAILEVLLNTPAAGAIRARLFASGETLHAPHLLDIEVLHVLRRFALARSFDADRGHQAVADYLALPVERYAHELVAERIWELRGNLTAYDAAYVALAELLQVPLVTCDARLAKTVAAATSVQCDVVGRT